MIDAELDAVKIPKMGSRKSHSRYPHSKSQYPSPPPPPRREEEEEEEGEQEEEEEEGEEVGEGEEE